MPTEPITTPQPPETAFVAIAKSIYGKLSSEGYSDNDVRSIMGEVKAIVRANTEAAMVAKRTQHQAEMKELDDFLKSL